MPLLRELDQDQGSQRLLLSRLPGVLAGTVSISFNHIVRSAVKNLFGHDAFSFEGAKNFRFSSTFTATGNRRPLNGLVKSLRRATMFLHGLFVCHFQLELFILYL